MNSSSYWPSAGTATDGTGYDYTEVSTDADSPKIGLAGRPCYNGWIDVKATHDSAPLLWGLIPIPSQPEDSRESGATDGHRGGRSASARPARQQPDVRRRDHRQPGCRELADERGCASGQRISRSTEHAAWPPSGVGRVQRVPRHGQGQGRWTRGCQPERRQQFRRVHPDDPQLLSTFAHRIARHHLQSDAGSRRDSWSASRTTAADRSSRSSTRIRPRRRRLLRTRSFAMRRSSAGATAPVVTRSISRDRTSISMAAAR